MKLAPTIPENDRSLSSLSELPIFFIVGRGRSGSTLLRSLFDAHPNVIIPLESRFVQFLYYKYASKTTWTPEDALVILQDLQQSFEPPELNHDNLKEQFNTYASELSLDSICKLIYLNTHTVFSKEEIKIIGDKNPRYTFFIPQLLKLFPNAKFIHLVRDYRGNIVTIQRAANTIKESGNTYFAIGRWKLYNKFILKYKKKFPDRFCTIRFEDLITNPEKEMTSLCSFLSIDFKKEILNFQSKINDYYSDENFNRLHGSLKKPFDRSKIGEWKKILPKEKSIRSEILVGNFAKKFEYLPYYKVSFFRRIWVKSLFFPIFIVGQIRFLIKTILYKSPLVMRMIYNLLLKQK